MLLKSVPVKLLWVDSLVGTSGIINLDVIILFLSTVTFGHYNILLSTSIVEIWEKWTVGRMTLIGASLIHQSFAKKRGIKSSRSLAFESNPIQTHKFVQWKSL